MLLIHPVLAVFSFCFCPYFYFHFFKVAVLQTMQGVINSDTQEYLGAINLNQNWFTGLVFVYIFCCIRLKASGTTDKETN